MFCRQKQHVNRKEASGQKCKSNTGLPHYPLKRYIAVYFLSPVNYSYFRTFRYLVGVSLWKYYDIKNVPALETCKNKSASYNVELGMKDFYILLLLDIYITV